MKVLFTGLGSIARRHIENMRALQPDVEIGIYRQVTQSVEDDQLHRQDKIFFDIESALAWGPHVAFVTNPASMHIETALILAGEGIHLFIEKPISNSRVDVENLIHTCRNKGLKLMVGYGFRFYEPLLLMRKAIENLEIGTPFAFHAACGQYLPDWRPGVDYRLSASGSSELGGGAILELSHELDYARWLMGEVDCVSAQLGYSGALEIDAEDSADILIGFRNGVIGTMHLDMLQRPPYRTCRVAGSQGTIEWDGISHALRIFRAESGCWSELFSDAGLNFNEVYIAEIRHFLECIEKDREPAINGDDAFRTLNLALAIKSSHQEQRRIQLS